MIKTLFASLCVAACCMGNEHPAKAGCTSYGNTATCTDYRGGNYTVHSDGSVSGSTGSGDYVYGHIDNDRFTGSVGSDYMTCDRHSCY